MENIVPYGAFFALEDGCSGFVHISQVKHEPVISQAGNDRGFALRSLRACACCQQKRCVMCSLSTVFAVWQPNLCPPTVGSSERTDVGQNKNKTSADGK